MADNLARVLSDAAIRNARPRAGAYKLTDGGGLFLLVKENGTRLWRYKFRLGSREGLMGLGAYPAVTLAQARELHGAARSLVAVGVNPVQSRRADREAEERDRLNKTRGAYLTVLSEWLAATSPRLAPATIAQRDREIGKYLTPVFKAKAMADITRTELAALLKRIEARAPEVARNLRSYMAGLFEYAMDVGVAFASPVPTPRMMQPRARVSHKAMDATKVGEFLRALDRCTAMDATKTAMLLAVLCVTRKTEATAARKSEFDLDAGEWTIPAERMKARREHWVPLPRQAVAMLRDHFARTHGEFLFAHRDTPGEPMAARTLNMLLERIGYAGETMHGFRSVFSTRFNAMGAAPDVVERCLAHAPKDAVRAAYNRHQYKNERREIMQSWADWLHSEKNSL